MKSMFIILIKIIILTNLLAQGCDINEECDLNEECFYGTCKCVNDYTKDRNGKCLIKKCIVDSDCPDINSHCSEFDSCRCDSHYVYDSVEQKCKFDEKSRAFILFKTVFILLLSVFVLLLLLYMVL
jgi:hypothetical protein